MEMAGPPPQGGKLSWFFFLVKNAEKRKKRKNDRNLVIFWSTLKGKYTILLEIRCHEFLLLYFFFSMSGRGEKNVKNVRNGKKWPKKINLSNDGPLSRIK